MTRYSGLLAFLKLSRDLAWREPDRGPTFKPIYTLISGTEATLAPDALVVDFCSNSGRRNLLAQTGR